MLRRTSVAILAAGMGTRMKSKLSKVLHRAGGKTLVELVTAQALKLAAPESIAVVVGHQAEAVRNTLSATGVRFADQTEQRGTGHALLQCREALEGAGELLLVLYGDVPLLTMATLERLMETQAASDAAATVLTCKLANPAGYGRIVRNDAGGIAAIVEHKAATEAQRAINEINSGIYCFRTDVLWDNLASIAPNAASGEIYLTDMVELLNAQGHRVAAQLLEDETELLGINTKAELAVADRILRERKALELMLAGVTIERPETVTVDVDVEIGQDTVVEPFAQILGATRIGADCKVGSCSIVQNATLADGAVIEAFSHVVDSTLAAGAKVGPYGRLRMQAHLAEGAVVGNFVELKKTRLGKGSKAQHLSYLGDATIGDKVNVGAGTITCNYDGFAKHETHIADGVFVGSNSTLVAPLEIGEGSYTAAGSVVTHKVAPDTLTVGRARQVDKPGWPSAKRKARETRATAK